MSKILHHPPHVAMTLDRVDTMGTDDLRAALAVRAPGSAAHLPSEVLVRLILLFPSPS